ncbi:glycoside hydrolase family 92 protein [Terasakiella brassicae]|nr:glycoside hydrolase family 92 protein [Terasakiella brassicae]
MVHIPGLWRRNNIWQYRWRVPHDVARRINRNIVSYSGPVP